MQKVDGYTGGVGEVPSALKVNIGKYAAKAGGYTTDKELATKMPSGKDGKTIETWSAKAYNAGSQIFYDGKIYELIVDAAEGESPSTHAEKFKLMLDGDTNIKKILEFFLTPQAPPTDFFVSYNADQAFRGALKATGEVWGYGSDSYNKIVEIDLSNSYLTTLHIPPFNSVLVSEYAMFLGKRADGTFEVLLPPSHEKTYMDYQIDTSGFKTGLVCFNYVNVGDKDVLIKVFKNGVAPVSLEKDIVKKYIDKAVAPVKALKGFPDDLTVMQYINNVLSGIQNGGGSAPVGSLIFAESLGVSAAASADFNTTFLNNLFEQTKISGIPIILPSGDIRINGTLNIYSGNNIIGAGWGGTFQGGTRIVPTSSALMVNFLSSWPVEDNIQDGLIANISFDGKNISQQAFNTNPGTAYFRFSRVNFTNFTNIIGTFNGSLIFDFDRCRFRDTPRGININSGGAYAANLITFNMCQFTIMSKLACNISGGASVTFNQCDWEQMGTVGDASTGVMKISNMSGNGEGVDVTLNGCWSEYANGGFWMDIDASAKGTTTIRDSMLWKLSGDAKYGVKNRGKLLITGSSQINGFGVLTDGGQTRIDGFVNITSHSEINSGSYKTAIYQ